MSSQINYHRKEINAFRLSEDAKLSLITDDSYTESQKTVVYTINKQKSFVLTHPSNDLYSSKNKMCRVIF